MSNGHRTATLHIEKTNVGMLVDPSLLSGRFTGHIAVLADMPTSAALSDAVPETFRAFGGAVKVIHPGAGREDHWQRHRGFLTWPEDDPEETADRVVDYINRRGARSGRVEAPPRPLPVSAKPGPPPARGEPVPEPEQAPEATPTPVSAPPVVQSPGVDVDAIAAAVAESTAAATVAAVGDLLARLPGTADDAAREKSRADAAEEDLADLTARHEQALHKINRMQADHAKEVKGLRQRLAAAEQPHPAWPPVVHEDPEVQFRYEIEQLRLLTYTPCERSQHPLRDYRIGPSFLDSLTKDIVPNRKATEVCLDIVTQRVWETRACHSVREKGCGSPPLTRKGGRDTAFRAYIKNDSPGAPRLLWWLCHDGTVELVAAAHHDDFATL